ncbi:PAAR domain-containing protein [Burkholderia sp. 22PA0099]|uniref:PAAR domain-containing protein n=1 Tax=Burkholderia sp. 22PA0099 TaxID=3237372 RepID=UPI0039C13EAE
MLKKGDTSSSGGIVVEGIDGCMHEGTPLTFVGARVFCHACQSVGTIVAQGPRWPDHKHGKEQALEGDRCVCQCSPSPVMVASQSERFHEMDVHAVAALGYDAAGQATAPAYRSHHDEQVRVLDMRGSAATGVPYHVVTIHGTGSIRNARPGWMAVE